MRFCVDKQCNLPPTDSIWMCFVAETDEAAAAAEVEEAAEGGGRSPSQTLWSVVDALWSYFCICVCWQRWRLRQTDRFRRSLQVICHGGHVCLERALKWFLFRAED